MRVMVLTDGKRIPVNDKEEYGITKALDDDGDRVIVKGTPYKKTLIGYFDDPRTDELQAGHVTDLWPKAKVYNVGTGKFCQGQHSIQSEINNIAREEGGRDWAKLITNKDWREATRKKLWELKDDWCDNSEGVCNCE